MQLILTLSTILLEKRNGTAGIMVADVTTKLELKRFAQDIFGV